jgi:hypothetical protein
MEPFTFSAFNERGCWPNNCSANLKDVATMNTEAPHGSIFCYDEGQKRDADRTDRNVYVYCTGGSDDGGNNDNQCGGFEGNNILSNGSFESPEVGQTNGNKYEIFDDIPNWSLPSNYIELQENGVDLGDGATGNAYAGDQWAELDEEGANQLQRTFNTTPGHSTGRHVQKLLLINELIFGLMVTSLAL